MDVEAGVRPQEQPQSWRRRRTLTVLGNIFALYLLLRAMGVVPAPIHLAPQTAKLVFEVISTACLVLVIFALLQSLRRHSNQAAIEGLVGLFALLTLFDGFRPDWPWPFNEATTNVLNIFFIVAVAISWIALGVAGIVDGKKSGRPSSVFLGWTLLLLPLFIIGFVWMLSLP